MKGRCNKCKEVYSITGSPNNIEGYFITQDQWEDLDYNIKQAGDIRNEIIYCHKCPNCGEVTRQDKAT